MENYVFQACFYPSVLSLLMLLGPLSAVMALIASENIEELVTRPQLYLIAILFSSYHSSPSSLAYSTNNEDYQDQERRPRHQIRYDKSTNYQVFLLMDRPHPNRSSIRKSFKFDPFPNALSAYVAESPLGS